MTLCTFKKKEKKRKESFPERFCRIQSCKSKRMKSSFEKKASIQACVASDPYSSSQEEPFQDAVINKRNHSKMRKGFLIQEPKRPNSRRVGAVPLPASGVPSSPLAVSYLVSSRESSDRSNVDFSLPSSFSAFLIPGREVSW
jgi:hypothetical protein